MRGSTDFTPSSPSLIAFKPRQVLLLEQRQRNLAVSTSMAKNNPEEVAQFKPEDDSILSFSVALWLENKGFSKVLKRFLSAAQIQDEEWKARALNLNEVFSKYQEICNSAHEDLKFQKQQEKQVVDRAERIGDANGPTSEEIKSKKKGKKSKTNATVTEIEKTLEGLTASEKMIESYVNGKGDPSQKTSGLPHKDQSSNASKESNGEKVAELAEDQSTKEQKEKKKKKNKLIPQSLDADEKQIDLVPEVTQSNGSKAPELAEDQSTKKQKEKKKKKSQLASQSLDANEKQIDVMSEVTESKREGLLSKTSAAVLLDGEIAIDRKSTKRAFEVSEDGVNESKKASKKRKRIAPDENENKSGEEVAVEESKSKKSKGMEEGKDVLPQTALPVANGNAGNQDKDETFQAGQVGSQFSGKQTDEITKGAINNGMDKSSQQKSASRQHKSSAEPKTANAFQRVKVDEVKFVDERLQDNSYWAKDGAEIGYGAKAQEVLGQVKGRDFRHEKTKKKRGSYRGGQIDLHSHSIKFNYSDEE